jgi:hypothetical protein
MVSVLAIGPKVHGFKPGRGNRFLKAIKIHRLPSFREEVKSSVPYHRILQHAKEPYEYERDIS